MQIPFLKQFDKFNDKYGEWVFYLGLFLMIVSFNWLTVNHEMPEEYYFLRIWLFRSGVLLLVVRTLLFFHKYPLLVLCFLILLPIFKYSYSLSGWNVILCSFVIIAASKDADIKIILRIYLSAFLLILLTTLITWKIGWTGEVVKHRFGFVGHSYGFSNPNILSCLLQMLTIAVLHYWSIKKTSVIWISCWASALLIVLLTWCLTSFVVLLLIPIFYFLLKRYSIPSWSLALLPWVFFVISILLSCYYGPSYGSTSFESRFSIPALVYQNHGLSLWGQDYGFVGWGRSWQTGEQSLSVDNVYMHLVLCDGVMIALFVFFFLSHFLYRVGNTKHPLLISCAIALTLSGMMEGLMLNAIFNFMLVYYFLLYKSVFRDDTRNASYRSDTSSRPK